MRSPFEGSVLVSGLVAVEYYRNNYLTVLEAGKARTGGLPLAGAFWHVRV